MIDFVKTYIKYIILYRWNKIPTKVFTQLDEYWIKKPKKGLKKWLYEKVKNINK